MNKLTQLTSLLPRYFRALTNKETPVLSKILVVFAILYIALPVDVVPDFFPFLGYVDDTALAIALIYFSNHLIPEDIKKEEKRKIIEDR